jgi:hypothetical protein
LLLIAHPTTERVEVCRSRFVKRWSHAFPHRVLLPASWYDEGKPRWPLAEGSAFWIAAITSSVTDDETGESRLTYGMVSRGVPADRSNTSKTTMFPCLSRRESAICRTRENRGIMRKNKRTPASRSLARVQ